MNVLPYVNRCFRETTVP